MPESDELQFGPQIQRALTASSEEIFQLLLATDSAVLQALLRNPRLTEDHLLALLKRRDLPESLLKNLYRRRTEQLGHRTVLAMAKNPATPDSILRPLLQRLRLFELVSVCYLPGISPDKRLAAERVILQRLPTTPLGNKITLARRATATILTELLKEKSVPLVDACLNNPHLKEAAVYQFLTGPAANAETISLIARNQRWGQRPNLRLAILKNRHTPTIWFTLWLSKTPGTQLRQLARQRNLNRRQLDLIGTELQKRGL